MKLTIKALRAAANEGPSTRSCGVCKILKNRGHDTKEETAPHEEMEGQPWYSGNPNFPVARPQYEYGPDMAYFTTRDKWGDHGYGNNRRAYALWLADFLEVKYFWGK